MKKIKKNLKWITLIIIMLLIIVTVFLKYSLVNDNEVESILTDELELKDNDNLKENTQEENGALMIYVDIKGAVINPGVYEVEEDKKVIDVVQLAGGFTEQADTSMINLAKKVSNEMVIIIYTSEEVKQTSTKNSITKIIDNQCICPNVVNDACLNNSDNTSTEAGDNVSNKKININNATLEELLTLSGIGESKAEAIIKYRQENGNFTKIEDIMEVSGIGEALYEKIKENITI